MSYSKQNFRNGQVLKGEHLNHIEDGLVEIEKNMIVLVYEELVMDEILNSATDESEGKVYLYVGETVEGKYRNGGVYRIDKN